MINATPSDSIRLLEADPDLGGLLTGARRQEAERELVVRVHKLGVGVWDVSRLEGAGADHVGLLAARAREQPAEVGVGLEEPDGVSGDGVDQVPGSGLSVSSPFITVDPASLTLQEFHNSTPVISFEVTLAANAPPGDYSIRLQSNSGEVAYLAGGITIGPRF